jgi:hypothetical protein
VLAHRLGIEIAGHRVVGQERLQLAREEEPLARLRPVERLHPQSVAGQEEDVPLRVPEREGIHAVQAAEHGRPLLQVELQEHLAVAVGNEAHPAGCQLGAQLPVVEDLPIEGEDDAPVRVPHGLTPGIAQVDDGQAAMGQPDAARGISPDVVGVWTPVLL